jgi:hypothetical protein
MNISRIAIFAHAAASAIVPAVAVLGAGMQDHQPTAATMLLAIAAAVKGLSSYFDAAPLSTGGPRS